MRRADNQGDETDWKVLAIDTKDPIADLVNGKSRNTLITSFSSMADLKTISTWRSIDPGQSLLIVTGGQ